MVDLNGTICALSSAPGRSGIALVRVSGTDCLRIIPRIFLPRHPRAGLPERHAVLGSVVDPATGDAVDEALVTCFRSPNSYTGEDVAEVSVHGSPVIVARLLEILCSEGARLAEPGEFTWRAFLNGRMDLAQAEAVRDVIEATTRYQAAVASRQRGGELSSRLQGVREQLIALIVSLEAAVEFVEEDIATDSRDRIAAKLGALVDEMSAWIGTYRRGRIVRDGFSLAIAGMPNAGKSSIFNVLLKDERSIVNESPGTTRDTVSEFTDIGGIPVRLTDTAGMREGADRVERLGVERTRRAIADSDAVLLVVDAGFRRGDDDERLRSELGGWPCVVAFNKADLPPRWTPEERAAHAGAWPWADVSALTGAGMDRLRQLIGERFLGAGNPQSDGILITNLRHCRCLESAKAALQGAAGALRQGMSEEFVLADLHRALGSLGEITGETGVEELLSGIFSRFCVGK